MHHSPTSHAVPIALVTLGLALSACTGSSDDASGSETPASEPAPTHLTGAGTALSPGTYQLSFLADGGLETPDVVVDVPDGYVEGSDGDDWYVVSDDGEEFLGLWVIEQVDHDACLREDKDAFDPGSSVADLADALVAQKSTRSDAPEPVTVAGSRGLYVEVTGPTDLTVCDKYPALWRVPERGFYGDGQVDRVWILDVDGQRLALDAAYSPGTPTAERDQLTAMVDSIEFVPASS